MSASVNRWIDVSDSTDWDSCVWVILHPTLSELEVSIVKQTASACRRVLSVGFKSGCKRKQNDVSASPLRNSIPPHNGNPRRCRWTVVGQGATNDHRSCTVMQHCNQWTPFYYRMVRD